MIKAGDERVSRELIATGVIKGQRDNGVSRLSEWQPGLWISDPLRVAQLGFLSAVAVDDDDERTRIFTNCDIFTVPVKSWRRFFFTFIIFYIVDLY